MNDVPRREPPEGARGLLLIAAREPAPGMTKTRLGATIGMARAAELYAAFLVDLAARFTHCQDEDGGFDSGWAFTPADVDFASVLQRAGCDPPAPGVRFVAQHGDGWDERQANIFAWGYEQGYERTVLIGSDSPQLAFAVVSDAFAALLDHDVAMGRTLDGGFYLIGMRGFHDVLRGVPMSTVTAAEAVAARTEDLGLRLAELPVTFDIDEERDLAHLRRALAPDGACAPATWTALRRLGLSESVSGSAV
jgi:rSAM/selenodomain-associated transferase 1